jgi:hypothetical protein
VEGVNLGFASDRNTSAYKLYIQSTRLIIVTNQVVFDESFFPYRKEDLIKQLDEGDDELDILYKASSPIKWLEYDPSMSLIKFTKVHMGSDKILILKSNVEENAFLRIGREDYFKNLLATTNCNEKARMVGVPREMLQDTKVKGLQTPSTLRSLRETTCTPCHDRRPRNGQRRTTRSSWALNNAVSSRQFEWRRG